MTKQEAIKWLEGAIDVFTLFPIENDEKLEVYKIALAALKDQELINYNPKLTIDDLQKRQGKTVWWDYLGGLLCICRSGYVNTDAGTFSFKFVVENGSVYSFKPDKNT